MDQEQTRMIEVNAQEVVALLQMTDRVTVAGEQTMRIVLEIRRKLKNAAQDLGVEIQPAPGTVPQQPPMGGVPGASV